ncbi:MAG: transposase family protein [Deltaproteobacteria bacterium]|nr:transposase family protein [Deltaproteobacteria bacterium]MBK8011770.1 transposase family protein [Deltaproteobacteria bacterium]
MLELRVTKSQESPAILSAVGAALFKTFGSPSDVPEGLGLRTDHGPQYTGGDCEELCKRWGLDHTLAPVGRPTGNAVTERLIRTMKEEASGYATGTRSPSSRPVSMRGGSSTTNSGLISR